MRAARSEEHLIARVHDVKDHMEVVYGYAPVWPSIFFSRTTVDGNQVADNKRHEVNVPVPRSSYGTPSSDAGAPAPFEGCVGWTTGRSDRSVSSCRAFRAVPSGAA